MRPFRPAFRRRDADGGREGVRDRSKKTFKKMRFLMAIIDALVGFVQRNPLTVLVVVVLALAAPALLKGIALFVLWFIAGLVVLAAAAMLVFRWRIRAVRRQMEEQFGRGFGPDDSGAPFAERRKSREGEVKVYKTSGTPDKRVSSDVGDYVEFEETDEKQK